MQVTPIGEEAARFHDNWLLPLCAIISVVRPRPAAVRDGPLSAAAPTRRRRATRTTPRSRSIWTLVPVLILVAIAIPSIRLLRHQYTPPPRRPHGQGHRAPMVLALRISRQWRVVRQLYAEGSRGPDRQTNQRARTDDDGPPLLAVDERVVIPHGKVVKFIITADDVIHSFAGPGLLDQAGRQSGPAPRDLGQGRSPGRLFRRNVPSCAAPATASCRSGSRSFPRHSSRNGSDRRAAIWRERRRQRQPHGRAGDGQRRPPAPLPRTGHQPSRDGAELRSEFEHP